MFEIIGFLFLLLVIFVIVIMVIIRMFPAYGVSQAEKRFHRNPSAENEDLLWAARSRLSKKKTNSISSPQEIMAASFTLLTSKLEPFVRDRDTAKEVATHIYNKGMSDYIYFLNNQGVKKQSDEVDLSYLPDRTKNFVTSINQQQKDLFAGKIDFDDLINTSSSLDFFIINQCIDLSFSAVDDGEVKFGVLLAMVNKIVNEWEL